MKKIITVMLICVLTMLALTGCGAKDQKDQESKGSGSGEAETYETIGDIKDYEESSFAYGEKQFVFVFTKDGISYRAFCDMPEDISAKLNKLDASQEDFAEKVKEEAAELRITKLENLNDGVPSQDELDKLVGKTGQELIDDGWSVWGFNVETMEFNMSHGPYNYIVVFDGKVKMTEDLDGNDAAAPLKVKSVKYDGIGDAANIEE